MVLVSVIIVVTKGLLIMRTIVNVSLPQELGTVVEDAVDSGYYASKSEFFRSLLRMWVENRLYGDVQESEREFAAGRGRKLRSLKDLR
jgi:Arc/MetJ-type ribon-helix-helix transcriptional regulator